MAALALLRWMDDLVVADHSLHRGGRDGSGVGVVPWGQEGAGVRRDERTGVENVDLSPYTTPGDRSASHSPGPSIPASPQCPERKTS